MNQPVKIPAFMETFMNNYLEAFGVAHFGKAILRDFHSGPKHPNSPEMSWIDNNYNKFVEALVHGWEYDRPLKKYRVEIPVGVLSSNTRTIADKKYLAYNLLSLEHDFFLDEVNKGNWTSELTMDEIKDIDPRFTAFAVEVE